MQHMRLQHVSQTWIVWLAVMALHSGNAQARVSSFGGHCYLQLDGMSTFDAAVSECEAAHPNAHIAIPDSQGEYDFIWSLHQLQTWTGIRLFDSKIPQSIEEFEYVGATGAGSGFVSKSFARNFEVELNSSTPEECMSMIAQDVFADEACTSNFHRVCELDVACALTANCELADGNFSCACFQGHSGNGTSCAPSMSEEALSLKLDSIQLRLRVYSCRSSGWKVPVCANISLWDTSAVTDMSFLFRGAEQFNGDLSRWNTSWVTNMESMFEGATAFNSELAAWDTSRVASMRSMFHGAKIFESNLSGWNTESVLDMSAMFEGADRFNANISSWSVGLVQNRSKMLACSFGLGRCGGLGPCRTLSFKVNSVNQPEIRPYQDGVPWEYGLKKVLSVVRPDSMLVFDQLLLSFGIYVDKGWGERCFCNSEEHFCFQMNSPGRAAPAAQCPEGSYFSDREWECVSCDVIPP